MGARADSWTGEKADGRTGGPADGSIAAASKASVRWSALVLLATVVTQPLTAQAGENGGTTAKPVDPETVPRPHGLARLTTEVIRVDGRLDERAWGDAEPLTDFVQSQPHAGLPATEPTVARILYDDRALYFGVLCYDSNPTRLVVTSLEYDLPGQSTRDMDVFSVTLDTFFDRRNSFIFLINPYGAIRDGQTFNDSREVDFAWRAVLQLKTTVHDSGWTLEMAIPWTTLRFDPTQGEQRWGLNMLRRVRRKSEDSYWAPLDRRDAVHRMSKAGTLDGLRDLRSGRNLRIKPFVLGQGLSGRELFQSDGLEFDGGLDVKWGITPGLTVDGTFRTDFSQVEVDQEQVNLTRFPLFFPEQRDFFVENSGSFVLGDVTERNYRMGSSLRDFTLFHSRRIGLSIDRRPIPIIGGVRLTGREGGFEIGVLDMQTESFGEQASENFGVLRVRRNLGESDVGAMFINRQATGDRADGEFNRSYGFDANLVPVDGMIVNSYLARSEANGVSGDRTAARVSLAWRDRIWDASAFVKHVGEAFDPGVGFVRRTGIRHGYATFGAHPRPPLLGLQEINPYAEFHYVTNLDADLLTRRGIVGFDAIFFEGAQIELQLQNRFERVEQPFTPGGDATVAVGDYDFNEWSATLQSSIARPLSARLRLLGGGYFGGSRFSAEASALWRPSYRLSLEAAASRDHIDLATGTFEPLILRSQIRFSGSTNFFANVSVQYNSAVEQVITNLRVNFIHAPLSDIFFVFTERRDVARGIVLERAVTTKITRLFAF